MKISTLWLLLSPFLMMSQQYGGAWTNIGPKPAAVQTIAVDTHGTRTLWMATISGGVRKSVDDGNTPFSILRRAALLS